MFRFFENLVDPFGETPQPDEKIGSSGRLFAFIVSYLRPFRFVLVASLFAAIVTTLIDVALIWYAGRLVDLMAATPRQAFWAEHGLEAGLVGLAIVLVRPAARWVWASLLNQALLPNFGTLVRWRAHRRILRQSVAWFQEDFAGRIANRVMQTAPAMGEAAYQTLEALAYAVVYLFGAFVLLADIDLRLAAPLLVWLIAYLVFVRLMIPRVGRASQAFAEARSRITGRIVDSYTNIQIVKLFAHAGREEQFAREAIEDGRATFARQTRLITAMDLGMSLINGLLMIGVVGWGTWLWSDGAVGIGAVAAGSALVLRLNSMTGWIMWSLSSLFQNIGVIREGMQSIAAPVELSDAPGAPDLSVRGGAIRFVDVHHHYGMDEGGGLSGVDLEIGPGERIGLVGASGAGKSTLVNLLLRFHDPETGSITIDGQDIATVRQESLRHQIGMVTQDPALLHRSVRDNIRYGRPDASQEDIVRAAQRVEADAFIAELQDMNGRRGYEAHVGERGVKLSGGQRQRIALARAILKDAPILVLDEATSALDSEVEAAIQSSLEDLMRGKTVIAIAHRLSTLARMDRIVVLERGRIAEIGTHGALLRRDGLYARFWRLQSGNFIGVNRHAGTAHVQA